MNKAQLAQMHPLLYELYKSAISSKERHLIKIRNEELKKLTISDIMEKDGQMYRLRQGRSLDWNMLLTYTEKMQWYKIFGVTEEMTRLSDKYIVRDWITKKIGSKYLIPLIGTWEKYSDIDFEQLPNQFVIKTNHGSSDVVVIRDKKHLSLAMRMKMKRVISFSMITDYSTYAYEMHYSNIKPKILVEKYIDSGKTDLMDYKFLCFDGEPYYCWVDIGRYTNHKRNVYDLDWNLQSWNQFHYGNSTEKLDKPENFDEMIDIAKILSSGFSHVRVDLYNVNGTVYFGEMTFTNGSGFEEITPESANRMLGDLWKLNTKLELSI